MSTVAILRLWLTQHVIISFQFETPARSRGSQTQSQDGCFAEESGWYPEGCSISPEVKEHTGRLYSLGDFATILAIAADVDKSHINSQLLARAFTDD